MSIHEEESLKALLSLEKLGVLSHLIWISSETIEIARPVWVYVNREIPLKEMLAKHHTIKFAEKPQEEGTRTTLIQGSVHLFGEYSPAMPELLIKLELHLAPAWGNLEEEISTWVHSSSRDELDVLLQMISRYAQLRTAHERLIRDEDPTFGSMLGSLRENFDAGMLQQCQDAFQQGVNRSVASFESQKRSDDLIYLSYIEDALAYDLLLALPEKERLGVALALLSSMSDGEVIS